MMIDPTAMVMADRAVQRHVLSARPSAHAGHERAPRRRTGAVRLVVVSALRRLADRLEPRPVTTCAPVA